MENQILEVAQKAIEGEISNLDAYLILYSISKKIDEAIELIKKSAIDEVEKIAEKDYTRNGFKVNVLTKTTWNFKHIESWNKKKTELSDIEEKAKVAAKFKLDASSETGEQIEPAIASYSTYLKIQ